MKQLIRRVFEGLGWAWDYWSSYMKDSQPCFPTISAHPLNIHKEVNAENQLRNVYTKG